jgi:hypothetical protein
MVTKFTPNGTPHREPPYTEAEEADFYRRVGSGPASVVKPAAAVPPQEPRPQPPKNL